MVFQRYAPTCRTGEQWVTPERFIEMRIANNKTSNINRKATPAELAKRSRDWARKNPEKAKQCCKNWASKNKERIRQNAKKRRERDPDYGKKRYQSYREALLKRMAERRKNDPVYAVKGIISNRIRSGFRKKELPKNSTTGSMIKCSWEHLKNHIEGLFFDGMGWDNKSKWHIDHIVPLVIAETPEDAITLNHWTNMRPLWIKDNLLKGAKLPDSLPDYIDESVKALWLKAKETP